MPLTNQQIDQIEQIYLERRNRAWDEAERKRAAIEKAVPEFPRLEREQAELRGRLIEAKRGGSLRLAAEIDKQIRAQILMKETLLQEAGYTLADLEPRWACPLCKDTGYTDKGKCVCFRPTLVSVLYHDSALWDRVNEESFDNFDITRFDTRPDVANLGGDSARNVMVKNLRAAKNFVKNFGSRMQNMLLYGPTGTGKTFLCNCIAGALMKEGWAVVYMTAVEYFRLLADMAFGRSEQTIEDLMDSTDLLIIDDLGTELTNQFISAQLFTCLNERHMNRKSTVISTNLSLAEMQSRYSDRVFSRITNDYELYKLTGSDIRVLKRRQKNAANH